MIRFALLTLCSSVCMVAPLSAEETAGVKLFRPDSVLGWQYGRQQPAGWTMTDGTLVGTAEATPLVSGFTFGDFELHWQWTVSEGGAWKLLLPEVPNGPGLAVTFAEGDRCGILHDGDTPCHEGGKLARKAEGRHAAVLRRAEGNLELTVDDVTLWSVPLDAQRRFGLGLALSAGEGAVTDMRVEEPAGEPLFNGADLTGWRSNGNLSKWRVEDGQIVRTESAGDYLRTEKEYGNFTLSFDYKVKKGTNSGLGLRTPRNAWPSSDGMELQILDQNNMGKGGHLAIYGNLPPVAMARQSEQWNHLVVKADGYMVSVWENGQLVQHGNLEHHPELRHRALHGWLGFQDHGGWTRFRDIRLLEAPAGTGLDVWHETPPRNVADVIDRVMNPWLLARDDGIASGTVSKTIAEAEPGEHVLAELTGPGAVVRFAQDMPEGKLAFYFDGEEKPRIEVKPNQLRGAVPQMSDYSNPVVTCLAYAKSLRIVLRDAQQGACRIDYVTVPSEYDVRTFTGPGVSLPRGWPDCVVYRQLKYRYGDYRNPGILPRSSSDKETLAPGATEPVLAVDGAGIVRYVRLRMEQQLLQNNNLWLAVTVDGESEPAVSAPVRFWLAGLTGPKNYYNLVNFSRNGLGLTQAMPFGNGITFSLRNAGDQPIKNIAVEVCVEPAEGDRAKEVAAMMRLRGAFLPAGEGGRSLAHYAGAGRLIAIACESLGGNETGIAEMVIDGAVQDGWAAPNLDLLLGQSGDFQTTLSGRAGSMAWRYFWLAPVGFSQSLDLTGTAESLGGRLALFYAKQR